MATHIFNLELQLMLTSILRSLEKPFIPTSTYQVQDHAYLKSQMLQEVCCAISLVCFCSAARIDPYTNRRCLRPRGMLCRDLRDYINGG